MIGIFYDMEHCAGGVVDSGDQMFEKKFSKCDLYAR